MSLPFPYWDPESREWLDDNGHLFEVRLRDTPGSETLRTLGRLFAEHFLRGPAAPGSWQWSGAYARFGVFLRRKSHPALFEQVEDFLIKAHAIAPIKEVVMLDGGDPLPKTLDAGPAFDSPLRPIDRSLPAPAPNQAFNEGCAEVEARERHAREREHRARIDALLLPPKPGKLGLRRFEATELTAQERYPEQIRSRFDPEATFLRGPISAPYVFFRSDRAVKALTWLDRGRVQQLPFPSVILSVAPRADGLFALVLTYRDDQLFEVDLTSGQRTLLWTSKGDGAIQRAHYLDDDTWAVSFEKRTYVLQREKPRNEVDLGGSEDAEVGVGVERGLPGGVREVARGPSMDPDMVVTCSGRLIIRSGMKVYLWTGSRLKLVGSFDMQHLGFHAEKGDEIVLRVDPAEMDGFFGFCGADRVCDAGCFLALTHVEEALKAIAKPTSSARTRKRKARAKISLEQIPEADVPNLPEVTGKDRARVTKGRQRFEHVLDALSRSKDAVVQASSGRIAAIVGEGVTFLDDARSQQLIREQTNRFNRIVVEPGGTCAFVQVGNHTLHQANFAEATICEVAFIGRNCGVLADFAPMNADNVLMLGERKLSWMTKLEGEWLEVDAKKISSGRDIWWSPGLEVAVVLTAAKDALQVWAPRGDELVRLTRFKEKIAEVRILGDTVYALWPDQSQTFVLRNVAQVREDAKRVEPVSHP